jgi:hypothetical protein
LNAQTLRFIGSNGSGKFGGGGVQDAHVGIPSLGCDEAREVETRVLHDDRRRQHGPADVVASAGDERAEEGDEDEEGKEGETARAATVAARA